MAVDGRSDGKAYPALDPSARIKRRNQTVVMGAVQRRLEALYPQMKGHWRRVAGQAAAVAGLLDLSGDALEELRISVYLMDIGMIDESIHSRIAGSTETGVDFMYNPDLRRAVESHPVLGARRLEDLGFPHSIVMAVRHHHEWYNGWGYPDGLSGIKIPLMSRILSVADAFVSITSDRPFRGGVSPREALDEIVSFSGIQFDPYVVPALEKVVLERATKRGKASEPLELSPDTPPL